MTHPQGAVDRGTADPVPSDQRLLDDLTSTQRAAVAHEGGPLLIIAGAGTGKTTVVTRRIAWLIATKRARPEDILALTFTEKAAAEMEERIDLLLPYGYVNVSVSTFHAFGDQLLRDHALKIGRSSTCRVLSQAEQLVFLRRHVFDLPLQELRPLNDPTRFLEALAGVFARAKDEAVTPEAFLAYAQSLAQDAQASEDDAVKAHATRIREIASTYAGYQQCLLQQEMVDFGDQVLLAVRLLEQSPDVRALLQQRFRYLLVDEFQDTNFAQFRLLQLLARPEANVTVVADDDQCLPRGTQVATPQGSQPIEQIVEGQEVLTAIGKGHVGTTKVTKTFRSLKPVRLLTLKTRQGYVVRVTDNHKMFCFLPTTVFKARNGIVIQGDLLRRLHHALDTNQRVEHLARDLRVDLDAHHACLNGVQRGAQERVNVHLTMCARRYRAKHATGTILKRPSILHAVSIQTSNSEAIAALRAAEVPLHNDHEGSTVRLAFADLREAGAVAERLAQLTGGILETTFAVGRFNQEHGPALLMPAKNILCGHYLPIFDSSQAQIVYDEVTEITETFERREVFDLEVERTHNFIADGIVVHNSIYKWRGAAISNVLKFLDHYPTVRSIVLTENFRSSQQILDCAYRLIRFNDPDRLEVRQGIDKRLIARASRAQAQVRFHAFDTASSEADWVARTIRDAVESGARRPSDHAILVRSNRDADLFLRALNVAGIPWQFSGASGLLFREESKMLISCLKALADPQDSLSWYHIASSPLYRCPMEDLARILTKATRAHESFRTVIERLDQDPELNAQLSQQGKQQLAQLRDDAQRLLEASRTASGGQLLYRWLQERGFLAQLCRSDRLEESLQLQTVARFFNQLRRVEDLVGPSLPELMQHLELFQALGNEPVNEDDAWADRVNVFTIHKAKGLEFPVVFLVRLVHGRFPTPQRRDPLELPDALIQDILPSGDYHLQEERRLFYVGMTRAKEELHLTAAYDYGGKMVRKVSQFVLEALDLATPNPPAKRASARELIERSNVQPPLPVTSVPASRTTLRLDPHGVDDYLTCPLKYRYSHLLNIPVLRHHLVVYGAALHKAIEQFFKRRLQGASMTEEELLTIFERSWTSEGFLTREHEQLRLDQGRETLRRFFARQCAAPEVPTFIEEKFAFALDDLLVVGRWDRVDRRPEGAVIIDYKSSEVRDQQIADRRTRESLQLLVYALAWHTLHGQLPVRVELRFLETDLIGQAQITERDLERAKRFLREAACGIRAQDFHALPQDHTCRWCAFQAICPYAFQVS